MPPPPPLRRALVLAAQGRAGAARGAAGGLDDPARPAAVPPVPGAAAAARRGAPEHGAMICPHCTLPLSVHSSTKHVERCASLDLELSAEQVNALDEAGRVELGFPYDFYN